MGCSGIQIVESFFGRFGTGLLVPLISMGDGSLRGVTFMKLICSRQMSTIPKLGGTFSFGEFLF